jgi:oxygen-dependent protoporphyrinogen oxidase
MLGTLDSSKKDVTIIGAGIAGLLLANQLDQLGYEVTLLEASQRAGGLLGTEKTEHGISETGPHSLLVSHEVESQFRELRVPLVPVEEKSRYVFRGGKIRKFPLKPWEAVIALFRAYFILADRAYKPEELTLERWSLRHLGRAGLEYLLTPFVRGIYGAEPGEVLIGAAFPMLKIEWGNSLLSQFIWRWRRLNPEQRARRQMMAPQQGMGQLVSALEAKLKERLGGRFRLGFPVSKLPHAGNLVICTPAAAAAQLVAREEPQIAEALLRIRYAPLISVTVFVDGSRVPQNVKGVGVLVPKVEKRDTLGILFNSSAFQGRAQGGSASFTIMLGGTSNPEILKLGDDELRALIEKEFAAVLGISGGIREIVIHKHEKAVPIYDHELTDAWDVARRTWCSTPGQLLFGNYTGQVSLRGMIETVRALKFGL